MAHMNQEKKKTLSAWIKNVLNKYWMKWTISVSDHLSLVVTIKSWKIDFFKDIDPDYLQNNNVQKYNQININEYHLERMFSWVSLDFLKELKDAMMDWNHDNSDPMTDYFDVWWYIDINFWTFDKDYVVI